MAKVNREGQATTLSPEQLDLLLDAAPSPAHRCCWSLMRFTGSRATETLRLTWAAVGNSTITFAGSTTKTKRSREVMASDRLQQELSTYRSAWAGQQGREPCSTDLLFPAAANSAAQACMTRQAVDLALRKVCTQLGDALPSGVSLHSFRRSFVTNAANDGASLTAVQSFTGHASLDQLQRYCSVSEAAKRAVLALI